MMLLVLSYEYKKKKIEEKEIGRKSY
jgi:hypothetical protein